MGQEHLGTFRGSSTKSSRCRGSFSRYKPRFVLWSGHELTRTQDCEIHSRAKDVGSATATWFAELLSPNPWFKDVVPNVSIIPECGSTEQLDLRHHS